MSASCLASTDEPGPWRPPPEGSERSLAVDGSRRLVSMVPAQRAELEVAVAAAAGSASRLAEVFADLEARLGREAASELWWAVFSAQDAAET